MKRGILLRRAPEEWALASLSKLLPGGYAVVFGGFGRTLEARKAGFELRDCFLVLGPSQELVWLFRKPLEESTVAEQVLKTGTGALNIDGTRVASDGSHFRSTVEGRTGGMVVGGDTREGVALGMFEPGKTFQPTNHTGGRWPSNLVLVHGPECRRDGTKKVKAITGTLNGSWRKGHQYSGGWSGAAEENLGTPVGYGDVDGFETVTSWVCESGCMVRKLDEQSGERKTTYVAPHHQNNRSGDFLGALQHPGVQGFNDSGGASRFFPQFGSEAELDEWLLKLVLGGEPGQE